MESSIITVARMLEPEIKAYKKAQENVCTFYKERKTHNVDYSSYFSPVVQENISKKEFRKAQQQLAEAFMLLLAGAEAGAKL